MEGVRVLCLVFCFIWATFARDSHADQQQANAFIKSIEKSTPMQFFDYMTPEGQQLATLTTLYENKKLWKIAQAEYGQLGFSDEPADPPQNFACKPFRANRTADSVHRLTPSDINVIGAVGDSLTAGSGAEATTVIGILRSYRGRVFSVGGAGDLKSNPSLPNLLRQYNPHLVGYATGHGRANSVAAHLDQGVAGAKSLSIDVQISQIVHRMKNDPLIDYKNDWKMISVFIGNNDICGYCKFAPDVLSPQAYRKRIQFALDHLQREVPRVFVNLISLLDVALVPNLGIGITCKTLHYFFCKCAAYTKNSTAVQEINDQYQAELVSLVNSGRYDTHDNFTVVLQPFFEKTIIPRKADGSVDLSYFAPDCFHFSKLGHSQAALSLWNSIFEPVGKKRLSWVPGEAYECPSPEHPYLATSKNSNFRM